MIILSWNFRGVGVPSTVQSLKELCNNFKPSLLFLMETKSCNSRLTLLGKKLGFPSMWSVDVVGKSGGLCLFWNYDVDVIVVMSNSNVIHVSVTDKFINESWEAYFIYASLVFNQRKLFWPGLMKLHTDHNKPWLCIGDFNEILSS